MADSLLRIALTYHHNLSSQVRSSLWLVNLITEAVSRIIRIYDVSLTVDGPPQGGSQEQVTGQHEFAGAQGGCKVNRLSP